jgi:hypothetical protein
MTITHLTLHSLPVTIANTEPAIETGDVVARLDQSLALLARYVPHRYRRMQRDVHQLVVQRFPCRGAYFPAERAILTELTFLVNPSFTTAQIAASIVHEATHARVAASLRREVVNRRPREERLCREAELEFGLALPDGAAVIERARASLALEDEGVAPEIDWEEAWRRVGQRDRWTGGQS